MPPVPLEMKKLHAICLVVAVLQGPSLAAQIGQVPDAPRAVTPAPPWHGASGTGEGVPLAVRRFLERAELCEHFAGEFNGDRSERDREVNAQLRKNRCDRVPAEVKELKIKYKNHPAVLRRLQQYE